MQKHLSFFATLVLAIPAMLIAEGQGGKTEFAGLPVSAALLPTEVVAPMPVSLNDRSFNTRLKTGGTIVLDGNDLILEQPNYSSSGIFFMALDRLELRNKARIVTGGATLVIFVNRLVSEDGSIVAFTPTSHPVQGQAATRKAASAGPASGAGATGLPGVPGDEGGLVSIHVIQRIDGILHVDLGGQDGGDGSSGIAGSGGAKGGKGPNGKDGVGPWCDAGGGRGEDGKAGARGGDGGVGGAGGHGGKFELYNVGNEPIPTANYNAKSDGGAGGAGGAGAAGGPGGPGGDGGNGSRFCGGGDPGGPGPAGSPGAGGTSGAQGAGGRNIVKNLELETIIEGNAAEARRQR